MYKKFTNTCKNVLTVLLGIQYSLLIFPLWALQPNYIPQTDEQRSGLLTRYTPEKLFRVERNFNAAQDLDMSVMEGDLVGVIKQQDPMGSNNRWLIDNGGKHLFTDFLD